MNASDAATLVLAPSRERSLLRRHPWIFSGSVQSVRGNADSGATVRICSASGEFLAWAAYSPSSRIRARAWDFAETTRIDDAFFERRIETALQLRRALLPGELDAYRLL